MAIAGSAIKADINSVISLEYADSLDELKIASATVDNDKIKAGVWYKVDNYGNFIEDNLSDYIY